MKKQKRIAPYIWTGLVISIIFVVLFLVKGIFPFGENSLIWGDMHDQVTAFYYHFYDSFHGEQSLFINFSTSGGINFLGILAYYLLSPISFFILLFPREHIYQAVSILIAIKVLLSGLTCLYFIRTYFKNVPYYISVLLAILYAFSGYQILLYQITAWIDVVYLFPLLLIGLKDLLDLKRPILYIVIFTLCLIFCFYLSCLMLFFIFLSSFLYLYFFKDKKTWKKAILNLGIGTIISLLLSSFVTIPAISEVMVSSRAGFHLSTLLNSKFGPLNDKLCFFLTAGFLLGMTIILFLRGRSKKHQKVLWFLGSVLLLLGIPIFIEPVNKMWHLGSYAFFPLRLGFILLFFLMIATLYYFAYVSKRHDYPKEKWWIAIIICFVVVALLIGITYFNYAYLQQKIFRISLGKNITVAAILLLMTFLTGGGIFLIFFWNQFRYDKKSFFLTWVIVLTNILCSCFLYFGIDFAQDRLTGVYQDMQKMSTSYQNHDIMRVKNLYPKLVMNHGMVTKYHTLDHFTSLTDKSNMETLKKLGYSSYWVKTYSIGGSLFTDALLGNQYLIHNQTYQSPYYQYIENYGDIHLYQNCYDISYGYLIDHDVDAMEMKNAFLVQNAIYQGITGSDHSLFTIDDGKWNEFNLEIKDKKIGEDTLLHYETLDKERLAYIEKTIPVKGRGNLYLEILRSIDNATNKEILESVDIYVNGKLFMDRYPREINNGLLDLGIYENENVDIRIQFQRDISLSVLEIGLMDLNTYEEFVKNEKIDTSVSFDKNKVDVRVSSSDKRILFLPLAYSEGYRATVNGKAKEVIEVFDNFIGIELEKGENHIVFSFVPPFLKVGLLISVITLALTILLFVTPFYSKLLECEWLQNTVSWIYFFGYGFLFVGMYLIPIICFLLSFLFYIRL